LGCLIAGLLDNSYWAVAGLSLATIGLYASQAHLFPLPRLAQFDDSNDRAILVQGDKGPAQVVRL
jgi:hypothetical protein